MDKEIKNLKKKNKKRKFIAIESSEEKKKPKFDETEINGSPQLKQKNKKKKLKRKMMNAEIEQTSLVENEGGVQTLKNSNGVEKNEPGRKKNKSYDFQMTPDERKRTIFVGNCPLSITRKVNIKFN